MYDKSKKTWSQRLKITKSTDKPATASVTTQQQQQQQQHQLYQQQQLQQSPTTMHLPATLQHINDYHSGNSSGSIVSAYADFSPSALSRSMKYAEPWIYGTVRGIPTRTPYASQGMYHHGFAAHPAAIFAAHPMTTSEVAIVICSCAEYLNGTKRDMKKASVCKKCKGSRLPLAQIGGTMRLHASSTPLTLKARAAGAATMRVVTSSKKMRPTILDPMQDPYDLMRRTRLLSPEPGSATPSRTPSEKSVRSRGKSASPVRGRTRTRPQLSIAPLSSGGAQKSTKNKNEVMAINDCWLVEDPAMLSNAANIYAPKQSNARRSILRCNVNPYDLISSNSASNSSGGATSLSSASASSSSASNSSHASTPSTPTSTPTPTLTPTTSSPQQFLRKLRSQNEFLPPNDDDFDVADAQLYDEAPPFAVRNNGGRGSQSSNSMTKISTDNGNDDDYEQFDNEVLHDAEEEDKSAGLQATNNSYTNVTAIAGQRISLGEANKSNKKSLIKQSEDGRIYESIIIAGDDDEVNQEQSNAKQTIVVPAVPNVKTTVAAEQPQRPPRSNKQKVDVGDETIAVTSSTPTPKAIRRPSVASDSELSVTNISVTPPATVIKSILKRPANTSNVDNVANEPKATAAIASSNESSCTNTSNSSNTQRRNRHRSGGGGGGGANNAEATAAPQAAVATTPTATATPTSQFYIPLPQARKKVQFMVEDKVIHVVCLPAEHDSSNELEGCDNNSSSKAQSNDINNDNNNVADDEEIIEFDTASTSSSKSTLKSSTLNYEYYERKREQQKLLLQQLEKNKQAITTVTEGNFSTPAAGKYGKALSVVAAEALNNEQQPALVAKSQLPFNLMSSVAVADDDGDGDGDGDDDAKINSNNNEQAFFATNNSNSKQTTVAASVIKTSYYEDVNPAESCESNTLLLSATGFAVTMNQRDDFNVNDAKQRQQQQQRKQQPQKQQLLRAFVATDTLVESQDDDTPISGNGNGNHSITVLSPLSRNPIRRSQSERHPGYNKKKLTNCNDEATLHMKAAIAQYNKNNNNGSNSISINNENSNTKILNFKDTMALRIKNVRQDSRDLFASNSTATAMTLLTSVRPREPPPPPPTTTAIARAATLKAAAAALAARTTTKVSTKESVISDSSSSFLTTTMESLENASMLLSPAGHTSQQQDDRDKDAKATKTARISKLNSTNGLENHNERQHKQQQQQQEEQQPATMRKVVVIAGTATAVADSVATKSENHQHSGNNGVFCEGTNRATDNGNALGKELTKNINENQNSVEAATAAKTNIFGTPTISTIPLINLSTASPLPQNNRLPKRPTSLPTHQRTVVRVAPFNKNTSEVHRLKITHTDDNQRYSPGSAHSNGSPVILRADAALFDTDSPLTAQKKTSILINGDDCYSTMNLSHDASTPLYQSSVVVTDHSVTQRIFEGLLVSATTNTVTINVSSPRRSPEEELIYQHNKLNTLLSRHTASSGEIGGGGRAIIPIHSTATVLTATEVSLQRSASSTSSASATSTSSALSSNSNSSSTSGGGATTKRGRTLIKLDYEKEKPLAPVLATVDSNAKEVSALVEEAELFSHEAELVKILRNPVEAVRRNLVPHVCGRSGDKSTENLSIRNKKMTQSTQLEQPLEVAKAAVESNAAPPALLSTTLPMTVKTAERNSFIAKLLEDPMLGQVAEGLETETIVQLIENSLKRLKESRCALDTSGTKDNDDMTRLINISLQKIKEERQTAAAPPTATAPTTAKEEDGHSNRGSISSANSFTSANNYEMFDFDAKSDSDCYQSCSSELTMPGDDMSEAASTRSKFYQMLVDATLAEIESSTGLEEEEEHHYESIRHNGDPIYEEITDVPPPLPLSAPPLNDAELEKKAARSMFEGASKYDILSYLVDAKERGLVREEPFEYPVNCSNPIIIEEEAVDTLSDLCKRKHKSDPRDNSSSRASVKSDSSEDNQSTMSSLSPPPAHSFLGSGTSLLYRNGNSAEIERNDSGVGSETSKSSRSKYQHPLGTTTNMLLHKNSPIHLCEDCDGPVETQVTDSGVMFAPLVCRKCGKKRAERKEIITEIVETEEKYGRDLQIILEEFCQPMLVAGLLTQEQLSAIFLNTEDLLENNQTLAERMRDALDISLEQGDDDLLTVNIGRIFLDFTQMLHAFESYCVRQAGASLLLANLEKEKELLRIFLKVSQMENTVLRRMNLNSFLMVPVQRVTKYPLLLARLYKVTPAHLEGRDLLKQAQEKIELHLNHINQEAKDVPTKLWRRISSSSPNRRASCEIDMINIKLRKMAIDVLEWNHDEVRFAMEGRLLYTQPTDSNWKKARTIKLTPVNALLVTNGKPSGNYKAEKATSDKLNFPKHNGIREASLLVVKEKCGRYTLVREPLYLDRCVVCSEADWDDYFEVQEISSKDTFIFKAEDGVRTKQWYTQLQYHAQGMGAWRKRRNALANIMINGMLARS